MRQTDSVRPCSPCVHSQAAQESAGAAPVCRCRPTAACPGTASVSVWCRTPAVPIQAQTSISSQAVARRVWVIWVREQNISGFIVPCSIRETKFRKFRQENQTGRVSDRGRERPRWKAIRIVARPGDARQSYIGLFCPLDCTGRPGRQVVLLSTFQRVSSLTRVADDKQENRPQMPKCRLTIYFIT